MADSTVACGDNVTKNHFRTKIGGRAIKPTKQEVARPQSAGKTLRTQTLVTQANGKDANYFKTHKATINKKQYFTRVEKHLRNHVRN